MQWLPGSSVWTRGPGDEDICNSQLTVTALLIAFLCSHMTTFLQSDWTETTCKVSAGTNTSIIWKSPEPFSLCRGWHFQARRIQHQCTPNRGPVLQNWFTQNLVTVLCKKSITLDRGQVNLLQSYLIDAASDWEVWWLCVSKGKCECLRISNHTNVVYMKYNISSATRANYYPTTRETSEYIMISSHYSRGISRGVSRN